MAEAGQRVETAVPEAADGMTGAAEETGVPSGDSAGGSVGRRTATA